MANISQESASLQQKGIRRILRSIVQKVKQPPKSKEPQWTFVVPPFFMVSKRGVDPSRSMCPLSKDFDVSRINPLYDKRNDGLSDDASESSSVSTYRSTLFEKAIVKR